MRKSLIILALLVTNFGYGKVGRDKIQHGLAGYAIGLTCNVGLRELAPETSAFERAWFCALSSFVAGAGWEYLQRRESSPDPNDVLATGIGGLGAGLLTFSIDF